MKKKCVVGKRIATIITNEGINYFYFRKGEIVLVFPSKREFSICEKIKSISEAVEILKVMYKNEDCELTIL